MLVQVYEGADDVTSLPEYPTRAFIAPVTHLESLDGIVPAVVSIVRLNFASPTTAPSYFNATGGEEVAIYQGTTKYDPKTLAVGKKGAMDVRFLVSGPADLPLTVTRQEEGK